VGTDPEFLKLSNGKPDYDWDAQIENLPATPVQAPGDGDMFFVINKPNGTWIVDNSSGLLGRNYSGEQEPIDASLGRVAILIPVEIKVHQDKPDPNGVPPKYNNAPKAYSASNLFVVWPNHEITVKVKLPAPFDQEQNLPTGLIKWQVPGHNIPDNTLEATDLKWTLGFNNNTKEIKIYIGSHIHTVHIKVQGVGVLTQVEALALVPNAAAALLYHRQEAIDYGNTHPISAQKDAMRHSYWCALSVSTAGVTAGDVDIVTTAHEYDNRYDGKQPAFNSTMDLQNNEVGMATNHQVDGLPDRTAIKADLTKKYASGEMYIWERPAGRDVGQEQSEGIIVKSNLTKVYP
jgi:hypothetical protein